MSVFSRRPKSIFKMHRTPSRRNETSSSDSFRRGSETSAAESLGSENSDSWNSSASELSASPTYSRAPTENWAPDTINTSPRYNIKRRPVPERGLERSENNVPGVRSQFENTISELRRKFPTENVDGRQELGQNEPKQGALAPSQRLNVQSQVMSLLVLVRRKFKDLREMPVMAQVATIFVILIAVLWMSLSLWDDGGVGVTPSSPIIAIMGETGAGKSSFIKALGGRDAEGKPPLVGHTLNSTTKLVTWYSAAVGNKGFYILDTPGFDDKYLSDFEILESLTEELAKIYLQKRPVTGIIYVHDISKVKMGATSHKSLSIFQKLVGEESLESVVLVTTHWYSWIFSLLFGSAQLKRESELQDTFWQSMLLRGSSMVRHDGSKKSAQRIVGDMISRKSVVIRIVDEMVNKKLRFVDTEAGSSVADDIKLMEEKFNSNLESINGELSDLRQRYDGAVKSAETERKRLEAELLRAPEQHKQELKKQLEKAQQQSAAQIEALNKLISHNQKETKGLHAAIKELQDANKRLKERLDKSNDSSARDTEITDPDSSGPSPLFVVFCTFAMFWIGCVVIVGGVDLALGPARSRDLGAWVFWLVYIIVLLYFADWYNWGFVSIMVGIGAALFSVAVL